MGFSVSFNPKQASQRQVLGNANCNCVALGFDKIVPMFSAKFRGKGRQIRFALTRGVAVSGMCFGHLTRGGRARRYALDPVLLSSALPGLSFCGCADRTSIPIFADALADFT